MFPTTDSGRIYANGPTVVLLPTELSKITDDCISTFSPITLLLILELGNKVHPFPILVLPSNTFPGYIIVSWPISTSSPI